MKIINKTIVTFLLLLTAGINIAFAGAKYTIDSDNSIVNFSTIKKQYAVEPAVFNHVTGTISKSGNVEISIDLNSIDTKISIRDTRIEDLFFKIVKFPKAVIKAKISMKKIKSISNYKRMEIPATLEFYGTTKEIKLNVLVAKTRKKGLIVTSMHPVMVDANDYGVPADNLVKLAETVGGLSISSQAAVNFVLTFKK